MAASLRVVGRTLCRPPSKGAVALAMRLMDGPGAMPWQAAPQAVVPTLLNRPQGGESSTSPAWRYALLTFAAMLSGYPLTAQCEADKASPFEVFAREVQDIWEGLLEDIDRQAACTPSIRKRTGITRPKLDLTREHAEVTFDGPPGLDIGALLAAASSAMKSRGPKLVYETVESDGKCTMTTRISEVAAPERGHAMTLHALSRHRRGCGRDSRTHIKLEFKHPDVLRQKLSDADLGVIADVMRSVAAAIGTALQVQHGCQCTGSAPAPAGGVGPAAKATWLQACGFCPAGAAGASHARKSAAPRSQSAGPANAAGAAAEAHAAGGQRSTGPIPQWFGPAHPMCSTSTQGRGGVGRPEAGPGSALSRLPQRQAALGMAQAEGMEGAEGDGRRGNVRVYGQDWDALDRHVQGQVKAFMEDAPLAALPQAFQAMLDKMLADFQEFGGGVRVEIQGGDEEAQKQLRPLAPPRRLQHPRDGPAGVQGADDANGSPQARQAVQALEGLGAVVYPSGAGDADWGALAGYEEQKRVIEDTLLLALKRPEVYEEIAAATRARPSSIRPRAVLFEGPPGCGKTSSARVLASQAGLPLIYVPLEVVMTKWYGESERNLADIFKGAEALGGAIIFLDEIDSLATTRGRAPAREWVGVDEVCQAFGRGPSPTYDASARRRGSRSDMHEATRRVLGVLLRQLDGFAERPRSVVIAATNRRGDLDPALLSRFDAAVTFDLPSEATRREILRQYARHLAEEDLARVAAATPAMSGRDLRDIAEQTERHWAAKIIRGEAERGQLPPMEAYLESASQRANEMALLTWPNPALFGARV